MSVDLAAFLPVREHAPDADEAQVLQFALERARAQFGWKTGGLDDEAIHRMHPPSTTSLAGLVAHLAQVEDGLVARFVTGTPIGEPWSAAAQTGEPVWEWAYRTAATTPAEQLYRWWTDAVTRSRGVWQRALAAGPLGEPSVLLPPGAPRLQLRRVLLDTVEEYLRHCGQADLLREAVDGLVGNDPPWAGA